MAHQGKNETFAGYYPHVLTELPFNLTLPFIRDRKSHAVVTEMFDFFSLKRVEANRAVIILSNTTLVFFSVDTYSMFMVIEEKFLQAWYRPAIISTQFWSKSSIQRFGLMPLDNLSVVASQYLPSIIV